MIETLKDMKRGKDSYESLNLERTANQILHHMEDKDSEDSLESTRARVLANARTIYGPSRHLDVVTFAHSSSRKLGAAVVEHNPTGRSYIHCTSAKESTRLGAVEHLLVITEDILQRLIDAEGISSSGWLPATAAAQHAAASVSGSIAGSVAGSVPASRRSSVQPLEGSSSMPMPMIPFAHQHSNPDVFQKPGLIRSGSDHTLGYQQQQIQPVPRTNSDIIAAPKPMSVGRLGGNSRHGRVQWQMGSEG